MIIQAMMAWTTAYRFQSTIYIFIWVTAILELISTYRVLAKAESPENLLTRDVLLGEVKDIPPWWHGFPLESLSETWISENFRRFQGYPLSEAENGRDASGRRRSGANDHHPNGGIADPSQVFGRSRYIPKDNEDNKTSLSQQATGC